MKRVSAKTTKTCRPTMRISSSFIVVAKKRENGRKTHRERKRRFDFFLSRKSKSENSRFFSPEGISPAPGTSHGFIASPGANGVSLLVAGAAPLAVVAAVVVSHGFGGGGVDMFLSFPFTILPKNVRGQMHTKQKREREREREREKERRRAMKIKTPSLRHAPPFSSSSSSLFFAPPSRDSFAF